MVFQGLRRDDTGAGGAIVKVRFWGTRGSIAKAGPDTVRYGGNTSCVEVRSAAGTLIVIDCGTGAHGLGQALASSEPQPVRGSLLISHTHWDHIQGIPFFAPLFTPGNEWDIYAPRGLSQSLRETLAGQMQYAYFPVTLEAMGATVRYHDLVEGEFTIDDVRVRTRYLNHPALTLGYRLESGGVSIVYACDHECIARQPEPGDVELQGRERHHVEFLQGADLVIHDSQYTPTEYANKIGWGHSTPNYAVAVSCAAAVRQLALTHYDPARTDDEVDAIVEDMRASVGATGRRLEICAAAEGHVIDVGPRYGSAGVPCTDSDMQADAPVNSAIQGHSALLGALRPEAASVISAAAAAERLPLASDRRIEDAIRSADALRPSLVVLDADAAPDESIAAYRAVQEQVAGDLPKVPVLVIADQDGGVVGDAAPEADWLFWPFTEQYARTMIRACVLRTKCRWLRAVLPENEVQRLAELRGLGVLDTEPEERFDRLVRIACTAFDVPIVLVSLVDEDRQWFKSCIGVGVSQTSREAAFCAHAILENAVMVVPDALLDPRFADNPLVTEDPRIRFYAGCPLRSPAGFALGTLCLMDGRPRHLDARRIALLEDLASLVEAELAVPPGCP